MLVNEIAIAAEAELDALEHNTPEEVLLRAHLADVVGFLELHGLFSFRRYIQFYALVYSKIAEGGPVSIESRSATRWNRKDLGLNIVFLKNLDQMVRLGWLKPERGGSTDHFASKVDYYATDRMLKHWPQRVKLEIEESHRNRCAAE